MGLRSELIAKIGANSSGFRQNIGGLKSFAVGAFGAIAASLTAAFSVRALKDFIADIAQTGDELDKMSRRTGASVETLQRLQHAAELSGADLTDLEKAFKRMSSTVFDAERGIKESQDALAELGVTMDELKGKTPEQQFLRLLEGLADVEDMSTRAALAQDLFGRSGTQLLPILTAGSQGLRGMMGELDRLGFMTEEQVQAAADFEDALTRLKATVNVLKTDLGAELLPLLSSELEKLTAALAKLKQSGELDSYADGLKNAVTEMLSYLQALREGWEMIDGPIIAVIDNLQNRIAGLGQFLTFTAEAALALFERRFGDVVKLQAEAAKALGQAATGMDLLSDPAEEPTPDPAKPELSELEKAEAAAEAGKDTSGVGDLTDKELAAAEAAAKAAHDKAKADMEGDLDFFLAEDAKAKAAHDKAKADMEGDLDFFLAEEEKAAKAKQNTSTASSQSLQAKLLGQYLSAELSSAMGKQSTLEQAIIALVEAEGSKQDVLAAADKYTMGSFKASTKKQLDMLKEIYGSSAVMGAIQGLGQGTGLDAFQQYQVKAQTDAQKMGQQVLTDVAAIRDKVDKMAGLTGN